MTEERRLMKVTHEIKDNKHLILIYSPGAKQSFREGTFDIEDDFRTVDALWSGFYEALDWCKMCEAEAVAVISKDEEGFAEWCRQLDEDRESAE